MNQETTHPLYKYFEPKANAAKIILQMLIGVVIILLVALNLIGTTMNYHFGLLPDIAKSHPLEITGYALAVSASVELAHMLFTPGPDEAIDPLILGLSAAALIEVSKSDIVKYELAALITVLIAGIGFLFWIRNNLLDKP